VEIIKSLERQDLLRFYDFYISPYSIHRRKLSLHVTPSPLVQTDETNAVAIVAAITGGELPSTIDKEISITTEIIHEAMKLTEQPPIVHPLTDTNSKEPEKVLPEKEITLPKVKFYSSSIFSLFFGFSRPNGSIMFMYGKVNYHVIHWLNSTKRSIYLFSVNYKEKEFHHIFF
jgi:hypothetical protein